MENLQLRATWSAYVVLGIMFGFITAATGLAASADSSMRLPFVACLAAWVFSYVWLSRFRIVVSSESLSYRDLFHGTRSRQLSEIQSVRLEAGVREYSDRFKPFVRLVIISGPGTKTINANMKVFGAAAIRQLLEHLRTRYRSTGMPGVVKDL